MAKKISMKEKTEGELLQLLAENRASLRAERFSAAGARAKDPASAKKIRVAIARIHTELRSRAAA